MSPEPAHDPSEAHSHASRRPQNARRATSQADVSRLLTATAAAHPTDPASAVLALHLRILGPRPSGRRRRHWDTASAALVAAASVDATVDPLVTALRSAGTERTDDERRARLRRLDVAPARDAVVLAGRWAWCALLCQSPDDQTAVRWSTAACRATQRALDRGHGNGVEHRLSDLVGQVCRSLVAGAADAAARSSPAPGLPPARLTAAIGGLGAMHGLLGTLPPW